MSLFRPPAAVPAVSIEDAMARPAAIVLLDVRGTDEWAMGHAPGAAHVPLERLHPDALPEATSLYVICRSGNRSARAVEALRRAGYDAQNVSGGMGAWAAAGHPVVRADGAPGHVL